MDEETKRVLDAIALQMNVMKARAMAHEAVFNVVLVNWGEPAETLMAYLEQTAERMEATGLAQSAPDQSLDAIREVMEIARRSLAATPHERP